jgi:acetyl-CoA carboxylase biotin carboxylase subunit
MFSKILIANRGEIAVRIIKTCRRLGIATVQVYSEADAGSLAVEMADEAVLIGPAPAAQSYLLADRIVEAVRQTGAEAVHPGFGFLSENAGFARRLRDEGIAFIGPNPEAIEAMGDKISSKKLAAAAGVSTVPGHMGLIETTEEAVRIANGIGYPVMIKASAGGGGKGMRVARDADDFARSFQLARSEALSAFGNGSVYVEKYLERPRHVEFQILGDTHGNVIHLGERDCSVQRRHQKLVEEAPCPVMTPDLRARMGAAAVKGAKAIDYVGAGTIEMLLDQDGSFYFMEMNTRIQVEHPVTEMLTGVDLVKEQIRIAAGLPMHVTETPELRGHVIECRVNAEDPARNFQPSPGKVETFHMPGGNGVRVDTHVYAGYTVPPFYDSMISKLIVHGADRTEALAKMRLALDTFIVEGVTTTIPFLGTLMNHPNFISGDIHTKFLEQEGADLFT